MRVTKKKILVTSVNYFKINRFVNEFLENKSSLVKKMRQKNLAIIVIIW